ncbi:MAG: alkaline phosphatase family protein [Vulcanimicrobiota bacterium]
MITYIDPSTGNTVVGTGAYLLILLLAFLGFVKMFLKGMWSFIWKRRKLFLILIVLIILIILAAGAIMNHTASKFDRKIIILGFDGMSPEIVEPMLKAGELPNFQKLKEQGAYRSLATTNPSQSPVAWSGFATGQNPGKNGVFDFIVRDPEIYGLKLAFSTEKQGRYERVIKSRCFWNYISEKKIPSTYLCCPVTFPPDRIYGRMLSGMGVPDILGTEGTFTFYTSDRADALHNTGGRCFHVKKSPVMVMNLIGPRVANIKGTASNVTVPFKFTCAEGAERATIEYQKQKFEVEKGVWSDFREVNFNLGLFMNAKGLVKFFLVETSPEFKLYISPINMDPRAPFYQISEPKSYSRELAEKVGLYYTMGMPVDTWAVNERRLDEKAFLEQMNTVFAERNAQLDYELKRFDRGVLFCYFESSDIIQHMFWRYTDPEHVLFDHNAPPEYREEIKNWYKKCDAVLGRVMQKVGSEDTLIVISDHGFNTFRRAVHVNNWLRKMGYLELKNPDALQGAELLKDIDWRKTRAYAIGFGAIYLNQKGRERDGIVQPGEESERLKKEIRQKLKEWIDEKDKRPVVINAWLREEIFWGDYAAETPDLYIGFNTGFRASWQTALGAVPNILIEDNRKKWSGDHLFEPALVPGVIFCNRAITAEKPKILDIAPTMLKITGFSDEEIKNCQFDGNPLW